MVVDVVETDINGVPFLKSVNSINELLMVYEKGR